MKTQSDRSKTAAGLIAIIAVLVTAGVGLSAQWVQQDSSTGNSLCAVHFVDVQVGYAAGWNSILKTLDGGTTWESLAFPSNVTFVSVFAKSAMDVFVGRRNLYRSTNGGEDWREIGGLVKDGSIFDIRFTSDTTGYLVKLGIIYRTLDGGDIWEPVSTSGLYLSDVDTPDAQTIYVTGGITFDGYSAADFVRSFDGGETWEVVPQPGLSEILESAWVGPREGYVFTFYQGVLKTTDGGDSWVPVNDLSGELVLDASFSDASTGFGVCYSGNILSTTNGGVSWLVHPVSTEPLSALARPCGGNCYAVGNRGKIFKQIAVPGAEELRITTLNCNAAAGSVALLLHSSPCRRYRIEVSVDLSTWTPLAERTPETTDWQFDICAGGQPSSFYRVVDVQREAETH